MFVAYGGVAYHCVTGQGARGPQFKFETQWSTTLTNEELEIGLDWLSNTNSNEAQQIG